MNARRLSNIGGVVLALSLSGVVAAEEPRVPFVRIAELEVDPAQLESYKAAVKEEMETSVRVEPGVLVGHPSSFDRYIDQGNRRFSAYFGVSSTVTGLNSEPPGDKPRFFL